MIYLNERILNELGVDWKCLLRVIEKATALIIDNDIRQPLKPYLRFGNPANRIIAMPAYLGGEFNTAGIKWIASFPGNITKRIKRAHSVIVLNDTETGAPTTLINTALISGIRTASVTGFVLKKYLQCNRVKQLHCGIIGFGPIGQLHLKMMQQCFGQLITKFYIYDIRPLQLHLDENYLEENDIELCNSWEEVYEKSNLFITCTVSKERYVNRMPKKGGIYLNVSLRDFQTDFLKYIDVNVVDNWDEICRENTDIENAHLQFGLSKEDVLEIPDILEPGKLQLLANRSFMFNPMGMGIFDIAVAKHYVDLARVHKNLIELED